MIGESESLRNRRDAGMKLAHALRRFATADPIVLALPRGGVPVGFEVAKVLGAPLEVLIVRKIGAPGHEEFGLGAVVDGTEPQIVLNDEAIAAVLAPRSYIEAEIARQLVEIERRRRVYLGDRAPLPTHGRTVILVDDGIATGGTVTTALKALRQTRPEYVILAVPVAAPQSIADLTGEADEIVCLATPEPFWAVGQYYRDFAQTTDEEVVALLAENRAQVEAGS
ncbi:phosphoribosyltransferase [Chelatococcus sp. GCM10030263]|uniref:phosphoribosyltransferase n=1 Tax=Chelatococcus sp. GCM10030263 TaxID=3273387 RepID=UPI003618D289